MNFPLFSMIFSITSTVVMGLLIIIALVIGYNEIPHIMVAVVTGFIISLPIAFIVTKKLSQVGLSDSKENINNKGN